MRSVYAALIAISMAASVLAAGATPAAAQNTVVLGGLDLNDYCKAARGGDTYAELTKAQIGPDAANNNWVCRTESRSLFEPIDMAAACGWQYQNGSVTSVARSTNDAYTWQCELDPTSPPTPAPLAARGPTRATIPIPGTVPAPTSGPLLCNNLVVTVEIEKGEVPTNGDDVIRGTSGNDVINGLGGQDVICALQGDDVINAGDGFDKVFAGAGNDTIDGGIGNDLLIGGAGNDTIKGGAGNDRIQGGGGADVLDGDNGRDRINGGNGNDIINGGKFDDQIFGNLGSDQLFGNEGNDVLRGGAWRDIMNGGTGVDGCTLTDPGGLIETRVDCESGVFGIENSTKPVSVKASSAEGFTSNPVAVNDLPALPSGITPLEGTFLSGVFDSSVSRREPIELTFQTGDSNVDYLLAHFGDSGEWEFVEVVSDNGQIVWLTNDFRYWGVVKGKLSSAWDGTVRWALDRTEPPKDCDPIRGDGLDWIEHTGSPPINLVHTCIRRMDDTTAVLVVKSNTGWPVELIVTPSEHVGPVQVEGSSGIADILLRPFLTGSDSYLIPPGREAFIEISRPQTGISVPLDIWVLQSSGAAGLGALIEHLGLLGWGDEIAIRVTECAAAMNASYFDESSIAENPFTFFSECAIAVTANPDNLPELTEKWLEEDFWKYYDAQGPGSGPYFDKDLFKTKAANHQKAVGAVKKAALYKTFFDLSVDFVQFGTVTWIQTLHEDGNKTTLFLDGATPASKPPSVVLTALPRVFCSQTTRVNGALDMLFGSSATGLWDQVWEYGIPRGGWVVIDGVNIERKNIDFAFIADKDAGRYDVGGGRLVPFDHSELEIFDAENVHSVYVDVAIRDGKVAQYEITTIWFPNYPAVTGNPVWNSRQSQGYERVEYPDSFSVGTSGQLERAGQSLRMLSDSLLHGCSDPEELGGA